MLYEIQKLSETKISCSLPPLKPILAKLLKTLNPKPPRGLGFRSFTHFAHVSTFVAFV
jgi:hypothetical protein